MIEWIVSKVMYVVEHWQTIVWISGSIYLHYLVVGSHDRGYDTSHESGGQSDY